MISIVSNDILAGEYLYNYIKVIIKQDEQLYAYMWDWQRLDNNPSGTRYGRHSYLVDSKIKSDITEKYIEYHITTTTLTLILQAQPREILTLHYKFTMQRIPTDAPTTALRCYMVKRKLIIKCGTENNSRWYYHAPTGWKCSRSYSNKLNRQYTPTKQCENKLIKLIKGINVLKQFLIDDVVTLIKKYTFAIINENLYQ